MIACCSARESCAKGTVIEIFSDLQNCFSSSMAHSCCGLVHGSIAPSFKLKPGIGNYQIEIESDRVAKTLTGRASAVGIVETEETRLRLGVDRAVILAFETVGKLQTRRFGSRQFQCLPCRVLPENRFPVNRPVAGECRSRAPGDRPSRRHLSKLSSW